MIEWTAVASIGGCVGVMLVGAGQIRAWRKNGSEQKARDEEEFVKRALRERETEMTYQAISRELHHDQHGLGAIEKKVGAISETQARHDERIANLEA